MKKKRKKSSSLKSMFEKATIIELSTKYVKHRKASSKASTAIMLKDRETRLRSSQPRR